MLIVREIEKIVWRLCLICLDQCPLQRNALPSIPNGFISNADNIKIYGNSSATGYYDIECQAGYQFSNGADGRVTCLPSGSWSTLPECKCKPLGYLSMYEIVSCCF